MIDETQEIAKELYGNRIRIRVCGVCIENEKILMVCHKGVIDSNEVWLPPGGGVEHGETLTDALKREFWEETGLSIGVGEFMFKREFIHEPLHAIELYFAVKVLSGSLKKGHDPELSEDVQLIKDVKWVPVTNGEFFTDKSFGSNN